MASKIPAKEISQREKHIPSAIVIWWDHVQAAVACPFCLRSHTHDPVPVLNKPSRHPFQFPDTENPDIRKTPCNRLTAYAVVFPFEEHSDTINMSFQINKKSVRYQVVGLKLPALETDFQEHFCSAPERKNDGIYVGIPVIPFSVKKLRAEQEVSKLRFRKAHHSDGHIVRASGHVSLLVPISTYHSDDGIVETSGRTLHLTPVRIYRVSNVKSKTIGILDRGKGFPILSALSGMGRRSWTIDKLLLNGQFWSQEVFNLSDMLAHKHQSQNWDSNYQCFKDTKGRTDACHAEKQIMALCAKYYCFLPFEKRSNERMRQLEDILPPSVL
jgi:hypothetical protein